MQQFIASYGYAAVLLLMLAESACIPVPSEVVMLFGGALSAGALGGARPALAGIIVAGVAGNVAGSYLAWAAGRRWGQAAVRRWGRRVRLRERDIDRATAWFARFGPAAVFFGRLVPVVRTFISLPAGFARMPAGRFGAYTAAGCVPWTAGLAVAGYALGRRWQAVANAFNGPTDLIAAVLAIAIAAAVILRLRARGTEAGAPRQAAGMPARPDSPRPQAGPARGWASAGRQRRALWQAVGAAEFAVLTAQQAGAQTGELDVLCHRLRLAAHDADRSLVGPVPGRLPVRMLSALDDLLIAAGLIQDAVASAATAQSGPAVPSPAGDQRRRAEVIAARIDGAVRAVAGTSPAGG